MGLYKNLYHPHDEYLLHLLYSFQELTKKLWETVDDIQRTRNISEAQRSYLNNGIAHINHMVKYHLFVQLMLQLENDEFEDGDVPYERIEHENGGKEIIVGEKDNPILYLCSHELLTPENRAKLHMKPAEESAKNPDMSLESALQFFSDFTWHCTMFQKDTIKSHIALYGRFLPLDGVEKLVQALANGLASGTVKEKEQEFVEMNISFTRPTAYFICDTNNKELSDAFAEFWNHNFKYDSEVRNGTLYIAERPVEFVALNCDFEKVEKGRECQEGLGFHLETLVFRLGFKVEDGFLNVVTGIPSGTKDNFAKVYEKILEDDNRWVKMKITERKVRGKGFSINPDGTLHFNVN